MNKRKEEDLAARQHHLTYILFTQKEGVERQFLALEKKKQKRTKNRRRKEHTKEGKIASVKSQMTK